MKSENNKDILLKSEVLSELEINSAQRQLDEWCEKIPFSPIRKFSSETEFITLVQHACFTASVRSHLVQRKAEVNEIQDDDGDCPTTLIDESKVDLWEHDIPVKLDFEETSISFPLVETRSRTKCGGCKGLGSTKCQKCKGSALITCGKGIFSSGCGGSGQVKVTQTVKREMPCDNPMGRGNGHRNCCSCEGSGRVMRYVTETVGMTNCSICHGRGTVSCPDCNDGAVQCQKCIGKGSLIRFLSIEQKEFSVNTSVPFLSRELPNFQTSSNPTSNIDGEVILAKDENDILRAAHRPVQHMN